MATMHGKEAVLAPLLQQAIGVHLEVPGALNTDVFGTFTREIPRPGTQLETATRKAEAGMRSLGTELGVASEGSFGPHSSIPLLTVNTELVVLVDRKNGLVVFGTHVTTDVRYGQKTCHTLAEAQAFASTHGFPGHAVVIREAAEGKEGIRARGVNSKDEFEAVVQDVLHQKKQVFLEVDVRAHVNPTRMKAIEAAGRALVARLESICPACNAPGWAPVDERLGLPCEECGGETTRPAALIYECKVCGEIHEKPVSQRFAGPEWCLRCNP